MAEVTPDSIFQIASGFMAAKGRGARPCRNASEARHIW
jgi:hypothetical protein